MRCIRPSRWIGIIGSAGMILAVGGCSHTQWSEMKARVHTAVASLGKPTTGSPRTQAQVGPIIIASNEPGPTEKHKQPTSIERGPRKPVPMFPRVEPVQSIEVVEQPSAWDRLVSRFRSKEVVMVSETSSRQPLTAPAGWNGRTAVKPVESPSRADNRPLVYPPAHAGAPAYDPTRPLDFNDPKSLPPGVTVVKAGVEDSGLKSATLSAAKPADGSNPKHGPTLLIPPPDGEPPSDPVAAVPPPIPDPIPNGDKPVPAVANPKPKVMLEVYDILDPAPVNGELQFLVRVTNRGPSPLDGIALKFECPSALKPEAITDLKATVDGHVVTSEKFDLPADSTRTLRLKVRTVETGECRLRVAVIDGDGAIVRNEEEKTTISPN